MGTTVVLFDCRPRFYHSAVDVVPFKGNTLGFSFPDEEKNRREKKRHPGGTFAKPSPLDPPPNPEGPAVTPQNCREIAQMGSGITGPLALGWLCSVGAETHRDRPRSASENDLPTCQVLGDKAASLKS